jgi:carbon-monoxide dehydrogenase medium subunit
MPILHEFEYFKPASVPETLKLLSKYKKAAILAGGTDIINEIKEGIARPEVLIDIKGLKPLKTIKFKNGKLFIGALVTFSELIESSVINKKFPAIAEVSKMVGSVGIRNRATMAGNICSAVPCMDSGPLLSAYNADIIVRGPKGKRKVAVPKWFRGPRNTSLKKGEFVTGIEISQPRGRHAGCYGKLGRYDGEDLAQASVLVIAMAGQGYRVAFGAVAPTPVRAISIEKLLDGKGLNDELINQAKDLIPKLISPITDIRATKEYRMHICKVMFERAIKAAAGRLAGNGPKYGTRVI